jgi:hypothetical protein
MAEKLQKLTEAHNPYNELSKRDKLAVELRLEGYRYKFIAAKCKVVEDVARAWFAKGGRLHDAYEYMAEERLKEYTTFFSEINERLKEIAVDAVVTLGKNTRKGQTKAASDVLDRVGFKATNKLELDIPTAVNVIIDLGNGKRTKRSN